jgi:uncharacterized protein YjaZ
MEIEYNHMNNMNYMCDNRNLIPSIKMAETIFENMGIDLSKIIIFFEKKSEQLKLNEGSTGKTILAANGISIIYILSDLDFETFITTFAHEVGHATQVCGLFKDVNRFITGFIAESIALKFEKEFLIKFNKEYNTNISVNAVFKGFDRYGLAYYGKNFVIIKTKSEYKLINCRR